MSNTTYDKFKEQILKAGINLETDDIRAVLIDTALYTFSAAHEFLSSVAVGARIGTPVALTTKTVTNGVFDADDPTFTSVPATSVEALLIYKHTGVDATARLIYFVDTASGLPFTTSGGNVSVAWDNGANKIFALSG